jgi:spore coat protein U-like protein
MKRYLAALAATLALIAAPAQATPFNPPVTGTMKVSTNVIPACTISLTDFAVGTYDANAALTNTHSINFQCTAGTTFQLVLSNFTGKLTSGTDTLNYTLANRTGNWANNGTLAVVGSGAPQSETLTATIAGGQYVPVGTSYAETITFSLEM